MNIAIVGSGDIGGTLGRLWAKAGHKIFFSFSHSQEKLEALARECGNGARAVTPYGAVSCAEVVLFSVPWTEIDEAMKQIGRFEGQTVIDATNPYVDDQMHLQEFDEGESSSECVAKKLQNAAVIKAFNTLRDETLRQKTGTGLVIFYAGDYPAKKRTVAKLIEDAGFVPYDVGPLVEGTKQQPGTDRYLKELNLEQARNLVEGSTVRVETGEVHRHEGTGAISG
jgi:predicted dinucleotide-binding enzyme